MKQITKKITKSFFEFVSHFNKLEEEDLLMYLEDSLKEQNDLKVNRAVNSINQFGIHSDYIPILKKLLKEKWHFNHKAIEVLLDQVRIQSEIEKIHESAEEDYQDFVKKTVYRKMKLAIDSQDAEQTEEAMNIVYKFGVPSLSIPFLIELLEAKWHYSHEDIASTLQGAKDERAIDVLHKVATNKYDYLGYDNSYPLARKCTWALADIGTEKAKKALEVLAKNNDEVIAGYAQRRIDRWQLELGRKLR